jgi:glucosamine--fructose-6-phosphate aminotransferase (isomerizing)
LTVTSLESPELEAKSDYIIKIPSIGDMFAPMAAIVPLQLFAYYVALEKGCDIDKPRNLAKSVTVE